MEKRTFVSPLEHFKKKSKTLASCKICNKEIKIPNYSKHGLIKHLNSMHGLEQVESSSAEKNQSQPSKKQKTLDNFVKIEKPSISSIIAELVSKDGLSLYQIVNSQILTNLLKNSGFDVPKSRDKMSSLVHEEAEKIRDEIVDEILKMKNEKLKFSFSLDEATTRSRYRILNIQLYTIKRSINLGMVLVPKTCPAETMVELTEKRLKRFNIDVQSDIIGSTTDGASVCKKFGRLMGKIHQQCYDHGIHLAVVKVTIIKKIISPI